MRQRFFAPSLEIAGNKSDTCESSLRNGANRREKMTHKKQDLIDQKLQDLNNDGIDRRGFLKCMGKGGYRTGARPRMDRHPFAARRHQPA